MRRSGKKSPKEDFIKIDVCKSGILLSTEWVDYVEEPMKYQALRPHFFSLGGGVGLDWQWGVWCAGEGCCGWWMKVGSV